MHDPNSLTPVAIKTTSNDNDQSIINRAPRQLQAKARYD